MKRELTTFDFEAEAQRHLDGLRKMIGKGVPLSCSYVRGQRPILLAIEGDRATLKYPNGATILNVPLRDLVDDSGYWKT